jgi:hypothetical protein
VIQNILDVITFKAWKGNRTKVLIALLGIGLGLHQVGIIPDVAWAQVAKYAPFILAYFGVEHADSYFKKV